MACPRHIFCRFIVAALLCSPALHAGQLAFGNGAVNGADIAVPVFLAADSGVAAMNFTVAYDPAVLEPLAATAGAAAVPADRQVHANLARPGRYVVVMMGLGPETVAEGEVAQIAFRRKDLGVDTTSLVIDDTSFAALDGSEIPSIGSELKITFAGEKEGTADPGTPDKNEPQDEVEPATEPNPEPADDVPAPDPETPADSTPVADAGGGSVVDSSAPNAPVRSPRASGRPAPGPLGSTPAAPRDAGSSRDAVIANLARATSEARRSHDELTPNQPGPAPRESIAAPVGDPVAPRTAKALPAAPDTVPVDDPPAAAPDNAPEPMASLRAVPAHKMPAERSLGRPASADAPDRQTPPGWIALAAAGVLVVATLAARRRLVGRS